MARQPILSLLLIYVLLGLAIAGYHKPKSSGYGQSSGYGKPSYHHHHHHKRSARHSSYRPPAPSSYGYSPPSSYGYSPPSSYGYSPAPSSYRPRVPSHHHHHKRSASRSSYRPPAPSSYGYSPPSSYGYSPPSSYGYRPRAKHHHHHHKRSSGYGHSSYRPPAPSSYGYSPSSSYGYSPPSSYRPRHHHKRSTDSSEEHEPECRTVTEEKCGLVCLEERCATRQEEICEEQPSRECRIEHEPRCTTENRPVPREKVETQCQVEWNEECNDIPHEEKDFKEVPVVTEKCETVWDEECKDVPHEEKSYKEVPVVTEECNTVMEEQCTTTDEELCTEERGSGAPSSTCPALSARAGCSAAESVNNCWSPGQRDVDCPGSAGHKNGLCCFNGCANTCLEATATRRICRSKPKTTCNHVPKRVCHDVTVIENEPVINTVMKPVCKQVPRQACHDVTSTSIEAVINTVMKPVCVPVPKEACSEVVVQFEEQEPFENCVQEEVERCEVTYNTVCNFHPETRCSEVRVAPTVTRAATSCPPPWLFGCSPATSEANCWSPGVPDVDCPGADGGHGLCCYNGCANVCMEEEERCDNGRQDEECEMVTREDCSAPANLGGL